MKKHYKWNKEYFKCNDKKALLTQFIEMAVRTVHANVMQHDVKLEDAMKHADQIARRIASERCDFIYGWKLHKTWFQCGFAQLTMIGFQNNGEDYEEYYKYMNSVYDNLGWDFKKAMTPKHTRVLTTVKLLFFRGVDDKGVKIYGEFKTLLEPTAKYPEGSVYLSTTGKGWEVGYMHDNGDYQMIAEQKDKYGNYREMIMTSDMLKRMKRIV